MNTCRTCSGFSDAGGQCVELDYYPNATVAEYGEVGSDSIFDMFSDPKEKAHKIRAEIYAITIPTLQYNHIRQLSS